MVKIASPDRPSHRAIALIGAGCRLPGAHGPDALWELLLHARDAVGPARPDTGLTHAGHLERSVLRHAGLTWPDPNEKGKGDGEGDEEPDRSGEKTDWALAALAGVSDAEVERLDPQHGALLATAAEALADAGLHPDAVAGTRTAVYAGVSGSDFWDQQASRSDLDLRSFTGAHQRSLAAGRVSYAFDLRGPSVTVDAAQASSLVAVHLAVQALRVGEADLAVAGGVNLLLGPNPGRMLTRAGVLSPGGRCRFGDGGADGFVRAEGVGVVVLKPLERALADGDRVRAVIVGTAVSNDGRRKAALTDPSEAGQVDAMRRAYADAGVAPAEVEYVEAHGTGTRIDQVELRALGRVLAAGRGPDRPCLVGSVKANIGHTEAAAGVVGLIKAALCLQHGVVPPSPHFASPHPAVDWERVPLVVPTVPTRLPRRGRPSVAAVNGQSVSSTNVHVVLVAAVGLDGDGSDGAGSIAEAVPGSGVGARPVVG